MIMPLLFDQLQPAEPGFVGPAYAVEPHGRAAQFILASAERGLNFQEIKGELWVATQTWRSMWSRQALDTCSIFPILPFIPFVSTGTWSSSIFSDICMRISQIS